MCRHESSTVGDGALRMNMWIKVCSQPIHHLQYLDCVQNHNMEVVLDGRGRPGNKATHMHTRAIRISSL